MKTKLTALVLITALAFTLAPKPAQANDRGLAIVGGFLGGLIVASAINDSRHDYAYAERAPPPSSSATIAAMTATGRMSRSRSGCPATGSWSAATMAAATKATSRATTPYRTDRVWVTTDRSDRHDHDYSYGYGR